MQFYATYDSLPLVSARDIHAEISVDNQSLSLEGNPKVGVVFPTHTGCSTLKGFLDPPRDSPYSKLFGKIDLVFHINHHLAFFS